ncbi:MAG: glycosyltransferase [Rhodospirillales bacterium]|nr:glycosyltransferase [Rhodospirillales bacterium]MSP80672.1 glycosyltransferase [Rhodospirillales bacterium]
MARPARHLILFARAPRFGAVKSRLARDIGPLTAWMFHRLALQAMFLRLGRDRRWRTWIALTPDRAVSIPFRPRPPRGATTLAQGPGDLGARMARALAHPPTGPAVLVGGDVPGIRPAHIAEAFRRLGAHDAVFGPAADGGYWLVGFSRRNHGGKLAARAFARVRWSSPHALADTRANLDGTKIAPPLETLADVDDGAAYARFISASAP